MTDKAKIVVLISVMILIIGQVMFKQIAENYNKVNTIFDWSVFGLLAIAVMMYAVSTGLWIWSLRYVEISKTYPYFALGFIIVPLCGMYFFGEELNIKYIVGASLIFFGIILTTTSS